MKNLKLNQMEKLNGGWPCSFYYIGVATSLLTSNPLGALAYYHDGKDNVLGSCF